MFANGAVERGMRRVRSREHEGSRAHEGRERDVVNERDDGANFDKVRVQAARGVGDDGDGCAEQLHDANRVLRKRGVVSKKRDRTRGPCDRKNGCVSAPGDGVDAPRRSACHVPRTRGTWTGRKRSQS